MSSDLENLKKTWTTLGREDPLWAVVSHNDKRGSRWEIDEFFETGRKTVERYRRLLKQSGCDRTTFEHVLDFGCGVGRLTQAWKQCAKLATGIDISPTMIENANRLAADNENLRFVVNPNSDLSCFESETFDLVASHICLQHMPWDLAQKYIAEFARVCCTDGFVAFQLPTHRLHSSRLPELRKAIINALPFGLGAKYRRWKNHSTAVFDMHYTPSEILVTKANSVGLVLQDKYPDEAAGPKTAGFIYVFKKQHRS